MIDLAIDRQLEPSPPAVGLDPEALLVRAERAESEARGLRRELGAQTIELRALRAARDWWMGQAKKGRER